MGGMSYAGKEGPVVCSRRPNWAAHSAGEMAP